MTAPDFGKNYPSGGETIGPAWQAAWDTLSSHRGWVTLDTLTAAMTAAAPVLPRTAQGLLQKARTKGYVEVSYYSDPVSSRKKSRYRLVNRDG